MTEQSVVEDTDAEAKPSVEEPNAQDDLETALKEFDEQEPEAPKEVQSNAQSQDTDEILEYVRQKREREEVESVQKDLQAAATAIKEYAGELPYPVPDDVFEGILYQRAEKNPAIRKAWLGRAQNPEGWKKVLKAVGKEFSESLKKTPDKRATEDWGAVESSMHSASTSSSAEQSVDVSRMTDMEFAAYKMKLQGG